MVMIGVDGECSDEEIELLSLFIYKLFVKVFIEIVFQFFIFCWLKISW